MNNRYEKMFLRAKIDRLIQKLDRYRKEDVAGEQRPFSFYTHAIYFYSSRREQSDIVIQKAIYYNGRR